jgi:oxygen-independent coproporphyrinogen-3 oxidase
MGLSLYIHYPFCRNLCSYCDFYKECYDKELEKSYFTALESELSLAAKTVDRDKTTIDTIYLGGGSPALAGPGQLESLIANIRDNFAVQADCEFTIEINPESVDSELMPALKDLGINRPVIGIQSFNVKTLKALGRKHNLNDSFRAVYLARAVGFDNFGIDMIFALPGQHAKALSDDLSQLLDLAPPHISYYQLTVEKNTLLHKDVLDGKVKLPGQDLSAAMYRAINEELRQHDYFRYEISSFAIPGFECRHNLRYWEGGDFLGMGPSAHSFMGNRRFANKPDLKEYMSMLSRGERPLVYDIDSEDSRISEAIMLGLRTAKGIDRSAFHSRFGISVEQALNIANFKKLIEADLIDPEGNRIKLTESGFPLADEIIRRLIK